MHMTKPFLTKKAIIHNSDWKLFFRAFLRLRRRSEIHPCFVFHAKSAGKIALTASGRPGDEDVMAIRDVFTV